MINKVKTLLKYLLLACFVSVTVVIVFEQRGLVKTNKWSGSDTAAQSTNDTHSLWINHNHRFLKSAGSDILRMKPPVFLPEFKNPCWYEWTNNSDAVRRYPWKNRRCSENPKPKFCSSRAKRILRCLPYFMLIGQPKCGSTDIYMRITDHPDVLKSLYKEPHWWGRHRHCNNIRRGSISYTCRGDVPWSFTEYVDMFSIASERLDSKLSEPKSEVITGEGSASTLWDTRWWWYYKENEDDEEPGLLNAHFIKHFLPDVKLLIILRNPTERLYSEYLYFGKSDKSPEKFHSLVVRAIQLFLDCSEKHSLRSCVYKFLELEEEHMRRVTVGIYSEYIADWMKIFQREQFLIIPLEYYSEHREESMATVYKFLGLRDLSDKYGNQETMANKNPTSGRVGDMLPKTRRLLNEFYRPFNRQLARLLDDTRFLWVK